MHYRTLSLIFAGLYSIMFLQGQTLVPGQDRNYPLYTELDSALLAPYGDVFNWSGFSEEKVKLYREFLKPYVETGDPLATYHFAKSYDLFPYGKGDSISAKIALKYYRKAAALKYADAEFDLYGVYRYGFMGISVNPEQAVNYMRRVIEHGDNSNRFNMMRFLAGEYFSNRGESTFNKELPSIRHNLDSTEYYLNKCLEIKPGDSNILAFLGSVLVKKGEFAKAADYYLQSDNIQMHIRVGEWLIRGDNLEKDLDSGLEIFYKAIEKVNNIKNYMSIHPKIILNQLYHCDQLITKAQLKEENLLAFMECP